jgi:hypothetical protein
MDIIGWSIGAVSLGYAIWTNHKSNVERGRMHSFLKGLKPSIQGDNAQKVVHAIEDEMQRLIPPRKSKSQP